MIPPKEFSHPIDSVFLLKPKAARAKVFEAIDSATSFHELLPIVQKSLVARRAWGDDLQGAAWAASVWATATVPQQSPGLWVQSQLVADKNTTTPVAPTETKPLSTRPSSDNQEAAYALLSGTLLTQESLNLCKKIAKTLLNPLKGDLLTEQEQLVYVLHGHIQDATARIKDAAYTTDTTDLKGPTRTPSLFLSSQSSLTQTDVKAQVERDFETPGLNPLSASLRHVANTPYLGAKILVGSFLTDQICEAYQHFNALHRENAAPDHMHYEALLEADKEVAPEGQEEYGSIYHTPTLLKTAPESDYSWHALARFCKVFKSPAGTLTDRTVALLRRGAPHTLVGTLCTDLAAEALVEEAFYCSQAVASLWEGINTDSRPVGGALPDKVMESAQSINKGRFPIDPSGAVLALGGFMHEACGYYTNESHTIGIGSGPKSFFHEWTHAMEGLLAPDQLRAIVSTHPGLSAHPTSNTPIAAELLELAQSVQDAQISFKEACFSNSPSRASEGVFDRYVHELITAPFERFIANESFESYPDKLTHVLKAVCAFEAQGGSPEGLHEAQKSLGPANTHKDHYALHGALEGAHRTIVALSTTTWGNAALGRMGLDIELYDSQGEVVSSATNDTHVRSTPSYFIQHALLSNALMSQPDTESNTLAGPQYWTQGNELLARTSEAYAYFHTHINPIWKTALVHTEASSAFAASRPHFGELADLLPSYGALFSTLKRTHLAYSRAMTHAVSPLNLTDHETSQGHGALKPITQNPLDAPAYQSKNRKGLRANSQSPLHSTLPKTEPTVPESLEPRSIKGKAIR